MYNIAIDFDEASKEWMSNKVNNGSGTFLNMFVVQNEKMEVNV